MKRRKLNHHIRLSLALGLEFQKDDHLRSVSFVIANLILDLPGLLAAALAGLLLWKDKEMSVVSSQIGGLFSDYEIPLRDWLLTTLPSLPSWWTEERRRWAIEWPVIVEAARLLVLGRWVFLEGVGA